MTTYQPSGLTAGRFLFVLNSLVSIAAPYVADFNETHVYNPNWPPHARFHNGQTMSMGVALGLTTLYLAFRASGSSSKLSAKESQANQRQATMSQLDREQADITAATLVGSLYWMTGMTGPLYPGALAMDPEFGEGFPQLGAFIGTMALAWLGGLLEIRRISRARQLLLSGDAKTR